MNLDAVSPEYRRKISSELQRLMVGGTLQLTREAMIEVMEEELSKLAHSSPVIDEEDVEDDDF